MPQLKSCIGLPHRPCSTWLPEHGPSRCPGCNAQHQATSASGQRTRGGKWARIVAAVKARDGGRCQAPGCRTTTGLEVHHLVAVVDGGSDDMSNLVTLCHDHHVAVTPSSGDRRRRRSTRR